MSNTAITDPVEIFRQNWQQARSMADANARYCFLATASDDGWPSLRTLVLREVTEHSLTVFINKSSPKWQQIASSEAEPKIELLVFWPSLMQQYRIRGTLTLLPASQMASHWQHKPYESKLMDHYYQTSGVQSSTIESRGLLLEGLEKLKEKFPDESAVPFPESALGVEITPVSLETWFGSPESGLHHRSLYSKKNQLWEKTVLIP